MVLDFINYIQKFCKKNNLQLRLLPLKSVYYDSTYCSGYFCPVDRSITVATRTTDWIEVLAHELGHAQQFVDNDFDENSDDDQIWGLHMSGIDISDEELKQALKKILDLEADAEHKAMETLTNFGICEADEYAKKANAHLHAYIYAYYTKTFPYGYSSIPLARFSPEISHDPFSTWKNWMMSAYKKASK